MLIPWVHWRLYRLQLAQQKEHYEALLEASDHMLKTRSDEVEKAKASELDARYAHLPSNASLEIWFGVFPMPCGLSPSMEYH